MGNDKSKPKGGGGPPPPAAKQPAVSKTVDEASKMKATIDRLHQRRDFLEKKMDAEMKQAKLKSKKGDKKGALAHLKRKKMYEKEVDKIGNATLNLEQQCMALESTAVTKDIVDAMKQGKTAMQTVTAGLDADAVADLQDDIAELQQDQQAIDEAISTPITFGMDEDELEDELAELEAMGLEEEMNELPTVPTTAASSAVDKLPAVPTHKVADDDDAALKELEAQMMA
uniref:Uncharacterized protein n=1 Tax=Mucochytrium quahogii TaxID=96639 RepID=A0A7S2SLG1_9STRA|mmetsp:Transcript_12398/g.20099  ORF Transcript_12398/g.20099 Transcript_12398/m.20099 type:complete len:228 (-) Transcript_12398:782-1465(-)